MTRMTGPDCVVMCNLINTHTHTHTHTHTVSLIPPWEDQCEWHRMSRMTGPDCAVMGNLINTHTLGCHTLVLGRVVAVSARGNLPSLPERLPERPMASALLEELKIVTTEAKRSQIEDAVGSLWAALAAEEDPQGRGIGTLLVETGAGGGEGEGRGERGAGGGGGGAWGRECWTARTIGGSDGNPV